MTTDSDSRALDSRTSKVRDNQKGTGVLQWQIIFGTLDLSPQTILEFHILRAFDKEGNISKEALAKK